MFQDGSRQIGIPILFLAILGGCVWKEGHPLPTQSTDPESAQLQPPVAATRPDAGHVNSSVTKAGRSALAPARPRPQHRSALTAVIEESSDKELRHGGFTSWEGAGELVSREFLAQPRVGHYLRHFTVNERGRATFGAWVKRAPRYLPMLRATFARYSLPQELIAVALVESGLDPLAVSTAGATGMWQFIRSTGRRYGLRIEDGLDERRIPRLATDAAARHLRDLFSSFQDWPLALAAYNAGELKIRSLCEDTGARDFWTLVQRSEQLPRETAQYVPKVLAVADAWGNLPLHGFRLPGAPLLPDEVEVPLAVGTNLAVVAAALGLKRRVLRGLNPGLLGPVLPSGIGRQRLRIPESRRRLAELLVPSSQTAAVQDARLMRRVARSGSVRGLKRLLRDCPFCKVGEKPDDARWRGLFEVLANNPRTYRVRPGDSLGRLAKLFGVEEEALRRENSVGNPRTMQIGSLLLVPASKEATVPAKL